jgi:hypothetical protein
MTHEELTTFIEAATVPEEYEIERLRRHPHNLSLVGDSDALASHIDHGRTLVETARSGVYSAIYELQRLRGGMVVLEEMAAAAAEQEAA